MEKSLKFILACLLLPALGGSLHFTIKLLGDAAAMDSRPWANAAWFGAGFITWLACFFTLPRPQKLYVWGHELTHALAVWLSGGKVLGFKIGKSGGAVISDKTSVWIVLAPYIFPLYPFLIGVIWFLVVWLQPAAHAYEPLFLFLWGVVWSFHISFTLSIMRTEQTDFSSQGYLFSFIIIFLFNWWILLVLLWMGLGVYGPGQGFLVGGRILMEDYARLGRWLADAVFFIVSKFQKT